MKARYNKDSNAILVMNERKLMSQRVLRTLLEITLVTQKIHHVSRYVDKLISADILITVITVLRDRLITAYGY